MIQRKVLKNGMTVVFKQRKNKVVSVAFAVRFGAANEKAEHKGIAHFIEHMLYKGTPTRDTKRISTEIEKNGGELNGFTSEQITAFWCKMPSQHLDVALDVLSDMVKNPLFDEKELNKERQVIFEEMKMYHDNPQRYVLERIKSMLYTGDFSIPIIGTVESMNNNSQDKLRDFFKRVYVPENMILCVVGDTTFDKVCNFAEKNFKSGKKAFPSPQINLTTKSVIEKRKEIDQANFVFAYHIPKPSENLHYAALVLNTLLAGGMSSRLFSEIREKRNLAYAVKGMTEAEKDYAYNCIYVGTKKENISKVKELILAEFEKVSKGISEKELKEVKEQIIGNYLISQEDSHFLLLNYLIAEITGNANDADNFVEKIKKVKLNDVQKLAKINNYALFALVPQD